MWKKLGSRLFRALGYEVLHRSKLVPADMAQHVRRICASFGVDCVIDVGANIGQFGKFMRDVVGYDGALFSFEPVAAVYQSLGAAADLDPQWTAFHCAIGAENGQREINVMQSTELSSFFAPDDSETELFTPYNVLASKEVVSLRTLDSLMPEIRSRCAARSVYLKIDTQGYDTEVIRGATNVLVDVVAIQTEVAVQRLYEGTPSYVEALEDLHGRGFDLSRVFPNTQDSLFRLIEADCILVNRSLSEGRDVHLLKVPRLTHMPM